MTLYKYGVPRYDNLLLFAPAAERMAAGLDAAGVAGFVEKVRVCFCVWGRVEWIGCARWVWGLVGFDSSVHRSTHSSTHVSSHFLALGYACTQGGNLIMAGDRDMSELMREIAGEFGVTFDKRRTAVIDHFTYEPALDKRSVRVCVRLGGWVVVLVWFGFLSVVYRCP